MTESLATSAVTCIAGKDLEVGQENKVGAFAGPQRLHPDMISHFSGRRGTTSHVSPRVPRFDAPSTGAAHAGMGHTTVPVVWRYTHTSFIRFMATRRAHYHRRARRRLGGASLSSLGRGVCRTFYAPPAHTMNISTRGTLTLRLAHLERKPMLSPQTVASESAGR